MRDTPGQRLWTATMRLTLGLLGAWLLFSVLAPWFARDLNEWQFLGFPLGFWFASQGALLGFLLIIVICIVRMERLEARYRRESDAQKRAGPDSVSSSAGPP
ncbi:MAG: DUF4212 domain-containing protein [Leptothrix sp. (in: Bacteria)]|nr:DUF4212 domain-containing protein [Leptothrix sp. (in: b-proteobacteria)]